MQLTLEDYEVLDQVFSGPKSLLFNAIRKKDKKPVIIKLLKMEYPEPTQLAAFRQEYEIMEHLNPIDNVQVFGFEKYQHTYAIILEKVDAISLREYIKKEHSVNLRDFLDIAIATTELLKKIHEKNIIHKDINPTNILYNISSKEIKIIDFGLAANLPKETPIILNPNVLEGTLSYISPEQTGRMNRGIDYRSDFYSLGVTFYEMLTGMLPFSSEDPVELVHYHIAVTPKTPSEINPAIPEIISDIIMKLLKKTPEERYQSAQGLITDLINCQKQLLQAGKLQPFTLGESDLHNHFQIPEKLYGREKEIQILLDTYDQVCTGKTELLLVEGYSGIGKTSLVHEIYKPILAKHGYYVSGKFDQFTYNIPYSGFIQAFTDLIHQILMEKKDNILAFREKIMAAVGENGQVIVDVIPDIVKIIGKQPAVPQLAPNENQNRFMYVFQNFINVLANENHPLVIFLDDLQWADLPSLKVLENLFSNVDCKYLFIIGAYRNNEVSAMHPLVRMLKNLKGRDIDYHTIELGHLKSEHISQLLADTLNQDVKLCDTLANVLLKKTGGNPFFLTKLLQELHEEHFFQFDPKVNQWTWEINKIETHKITDNVVDLLIKKIKLFPEATQNVLKIASCIGNKFDLNMLTEVCKTSSDNIIPQLQELLQNDFILRNRITNTSTYFQFSHDKIRQAAYSLLDKDAQKLKHLEIARTLIRTTPENKINEYIFEIVNHYNTAVDPVIETQALVADKDSMAKLNLRAAKLAKTSAAFEPAFQYINYAIVCSDKKTWETNYEFMFELYLEATEIAYINSKFKTMEKYAKKALAHAVNIYDELKILQIEILSAHAQMRLQEAVNLAKIALKRLHVHLPKTATQLRILWEILKVKFFLIAKKISQLINLPISDNPQQKAIMKLLSLIYSVAYQTDTNLYPILVCTGVKLSLLRGNTGESGMPYATYGIISCGILNEINAGYEFGELALKLLDKTQEEKSRAKVVFINYAFIKHWKDSVRNDVPKFLESFDNALVIGDVEYACYNLFFYHLYALAAGFSIEELLSQIKIHKKRVNALQQNSIYTSYLNVCQQALINMIKKQDNPGLLVGTVFDEIKTAPVFESMHAMSALFCLYYNKLVLQFLFDQLPDALETIKLCDKYADAAVATFLIPIFEFYKALVFMACYETASPQNRKEYLKKVNQIKKRFHMWSKSSPKNHTQKCFLIEAELARINKQTEKAQEYYDKAIECANKNEFINDEALANELAGKFYLSLHKNKIAGVYLKDARYCYQLWKAIAKVQQLEQTYQQLFVSQILSAEKRPTISTSRIGQSGTLLLDMHSIQKSAQMISGTIILADLLKNLMRIALVNAGAEKSYLLLYKKNKLVIQAEGQTAQKEIKVLESLPINENNLPISIINFVANSHEIVILDDAENSRHFSNDLYIRKGHVKSVLCIPLLKQRRLIGILYLENNLTEDVFTKDRIEVLNVLSGQIATSIENAELYENVLQLKEAYERFVPRDFLNLLEKESIVDVSLGDHTQKNMTIVFTDIRNFTALSEKLSPVENFAFINEFLAYMEPVITAHKGFIDKYIGDAIMALFPTNADDAVQCAIEMQQKLQEFNQKRQKDNLEPIDMGIGINSGLLMLGTIGGKERMEETVISDAVNIASRAENMTKDYKVPIIITQNTFHQLKNPSLYNITMLDQVLFRGKSQKITIYSVNIPPAKVI